MNLDQLEKKWEWIMRGAALLLVVAVVCSYFLPPSTTRYIAFASLPICLILFFVARAKARPDEEFKDTPWGI
jgi:hypothetical protein